MFIFEDFFEDFYSEYKEAKIKLQQLENIFVTKFIESMSKANDVKQMESIVENYLTINLDNKMFRNMQDEFHYYLIVFMCLDDGAVKLKLFKLLKKLFFRYRMILKKGDNQELLDKRDKMIDEIVEFLEKNKITEVANVNCLKQYIKLD